MSNRRGIALLAALWLVVAIATVALTLGLEAREHRTVGMAASDRSAAYAAAVGGLAIARARLERVARQPPRLTVANSSWLRTSDLWIDAESLFTDTLRLGDIKVRVHAEDLDAKLDINFLELPELRIFLSSILQDYAIADALAQAISDWRDKDNLPQPRGAERKEYLARRRLDLPTNRSFRTVDGLRWVEGMTPEVFTRIRPYLTTQKSDTENRVNINAAAEPVLRAIPGMTNAMVTRILAFRSQRRRLSSIEELVPSQRGAQDARLERLGASIRFTTLHLELTATALLPPPGHPVEERMTIMLLNTAEGGPSDPANKSVVSWL